MRHLNRTSLAVSGFALLVPVGAMFAALSDDGGVVHEPGVCCGGDYALTGGLARGDGITLTGGGFALDGGLWLEESATPAALTAVELRGGGTMSGDLAALGAVDDVTLAITPDPAEINPDVGAREVIVRAVTHVDSPVTLAVTLDSHISDPGGSVEVLLKNWRTDTFVPVGKDSAGISRRTATFEDIAAMDYVNDAGEIELLTRHDAAVSFFTAGLSVHIDRVAITVE